MACCSKSGVAVFIAVAAIGLGLDLWTKSYMFSWLGMPGLHEPVWLWEGILSFETSLNEGALFGLGQGWGVLFIALSALALAGIVYWVVWKGAAADPWLNFSLALLVGGILGNLYDRVGLPGLRWHGPFRGHTVGEPVYAVRDWIHFQCPWFDWPVFNLADSYLVCGVAILALHAYVIEPLRARRNSATATANDNTANKASGSAA